jgi:hypothetical protein
MSEVVLGLFRDSILLPFAPKSHPYYDRSDASYLVRMLLYRNCCGHDLTGERRAKDTG